MPRRLNIPTHRLARILNSIDKICHEVTNHPDIQVRLLGFSRKHQGFTAHHQVRVTLLRSIGWTYPKIYNHTNIPSGTATHWEKSKSGTKILKYLIANGYIQIMDIVDILTGKDY